MENEKSKNRVINSQLSIINYFAWLILLVQILAFWAVWSWYAKRLIDSDGESWSLLALAAAVAVCVLRNRESKIGWRLSQSNLILPAVLTVVYAASFGFVPPLVRAMLAMTAICATISQTVFRKTFDFGTGVLLLLSLPLAASLNFYLGFPLRVAAGEAAAFLLRTNGLRVWRTGVCLEFGEQLISIDAPCSGVRMLWFGLFLTAVLTVFFKFNLPRSILALTLSFAAILLGNIARASTLFYVETGIIKAPAWTHEAVGVFAFALVALAIVLIAQTLRGDFKWSNLQFS